MTLDDLVAMKLKKEESERKAIEIEVPSTKKVLQFQKPKDNLTLEVVDEIGTNGSTGNVVSAYKKLIYHSCPMLQDTKLHEQLGVVNPYDIILALFEISDILLIGDELFNFTGASDLYESTKN